MVNVAARCRLCDDLPPPPPCRLTASSDSAGRLRPDSKTKTHKRVKFITRNIYMHCVVQYVQYVYNITIELSAATSQGVMRAVVGGGRGESKNKLYGPLKLPPERVWVSSVFVRGIWWWSAFCTCTNSLCPSEVFAKAETHPRWMRTITRR